MNQIDLFKGIPEDPKLAARKYAHQELAEFTLDNMYRSVFYQMRTLLPGISRGHAREDAYCTLLLANNKLIFRTRHSETYIECPTDIYISTCFYFTDFMEVLKNARSKELHFKVKVGNLQINNRTISCHSKILELSEMKELVKEGPVAWDLDYTKTDYFDSPEMKAKEFHLASGGKRFFENEIIKDAEKAEMLLRKYKIYSYEILDLIKSKMKDSKGS